MQTILFDIDGTLIATGGAGLHAMAETMKQLYGIAELPPLDVRGRTDHGIVRDLFNQVQLDFDQIFQRFSTHYWALLPGSIDSLPGRVLPGIHRLLDTLHAHNHVCLGLLTGNAQRAAQIKLQKFGLDHYFKFGGYGDLHSCRDDVARCAIESAREKIGSDFDSSQVWVIGDTVHDIHCGRAIGSKVIAVETGGSCPIELQIAAPDFQFASFEAHFDEARALFRC